MKFDSPFLDALNDRVLLWDGAMGTQIHAAELKPDDFILHDQPDFPTAIRETARSLTKDQLDGCNEALVFSRPEVIEAIHSRYFEAGSDIVETNTFGSTSIVLDEYGIGRLDYELSKQAAVVAKSAAAKYENKFVCGALGPGTKLISLGQVSWEEAQTTYRRCFTGLIEGGVDCLMLETMQDLLLVKAGITAALDAMAETGIRLPLILQVTMEQTGTMLLGTEMGAALCMAECFPEICVIGLNCATGPVEMNQHVRFLANHSTRPITVQPNAGLPVMEKGQAVYKLTPDELAMHQERFVTEYGAAMIGGCCGTTPAHIQALSGLKGRKHTADVHWRRTQNLYQGFDFTLDNAEKADGLSLVGAASLYQFQPYHQDASCLIVGEKTNANGSKAFREMLAVENWEGITELARELEGEGSHLLDVCTAYVGRDEVRDMREVLTRCNTQITVPIMIDSTEVPVIESALQTLAGKPIVNSINFEDGEARTEKVLKLCRRYGAGVVALTIDEAGMAKTAEKKVEIAERILARARANGIPDHDVFIDCLTFTLGSGDEEFRYAGVETIDAIRELMIRHPKVNTILGVSNISFGLKPSARLVLNSAFLHFAQEAGLSSAIVHFSKIKPESQIEPEVWKIASDLVYDRREFALSSST